MERARGFTLFPEALRQIGGKMQKGDFAFFERVGSEILF